MKKSDGNASIAAGGLLSLGMFACPNGPCVFCAAPPLLFIASGVWVKMRGKGKTGQRGSKF